MKSSSEATNIAPLTKKYIFEVKGRLFVPNLIFSQSPIVSVEMCFINWLKMRLGTNKLPFTSARYIWDAIYYETSYVFVAIIECSRNEHTMYNL